MLRRAFLHGVATMLAAAAMSYPLTRQLAAPVAVKPKNPQAIDYPRFWSSIQEHWDGEFTDVVFGPNDCVDRFFGLPARSSSSNQIMASTR